MRVRRAMWASPGISSALKLGVNIPRLTTGLLAYKTYWPRCFPIQFTLFPCPFPFIILCFNLLRSTVLHCYNFSAKASEVNMAPSFVLSIFILFPFDAKVFDIFFVRIAVKSICLLWMRSIVTDGVIPSIWPTTAPTLMKTRDKTNRTTNQPTKKQTSKLSKAGHLHMLLFIVWLELLVEAFGCHRSPTSNWYNEDPFLGPASVTKTHRSYIEGEKTIWTTPLLCQTFNSLPHFPLDQY